MHGRAAVRSWLETHRPSEPFHLIAIGKAASAMAAGALDAASDELRSGLVVTGHSYLDELVYQDPRLLHLESGHPLPDELSLSAGIAL